MPAFPLAFSKRIEDLVTAEICALEELAEVAGACAETIWAAASQQTTRQTKKERRSISVPSLFGSRCRAREVYGSSGVQQHLRNAILRRVLGTGMAADAVTLLAATNPEPAVFLANDTALCVEQNE